MVVAVTSMLAASVITYGATARRTMQLSLEQAKLAQLISRARALTLTTYSEPNRPCGYGVLIDAANREYQLFRYLETPGTPPRCVAPLSGGVLDPALISPATERIAMSDGIGVATTQPDSLGRIIFRRPNPDVYTFAPPVGASENLIGGTTRVYFEISGGGAQRILTINQSGQVGF